MCCEGQARMVRISFWFLFLGLICVIQAYEEFIKPDEDQNKIVVLDEGVVVGEKHWYEDFYEFFGVPYASVPRGRDKFKSPLPPKPWDNVLYAKQRILCPQTFYSGEDDEDILVEGEEECLHMNLLVPGEANENNLVPVLVYIHSGGYAAGNANMAKFNYLARHDVLVVSFNYRLGSIGFNCLGTEEIPGNAGMKDQVAALRWINKNIAKFGGDPKKVTLAGYSVGAAMAELLVLSKSTAGLFDKLILESGSALSSYSVNSDPISTAFNIAKSVGYNGTDNIKELNEFYLNASLETLTSKSLHFLLTNSTFGFVPCIENKQKGVEPFLTKSPKDILTAGDYPKLPLLTGFSNMEGLSRTLKFDEWSEMMNEKFEDFIPADLNFNNEKERKTIIKAILKRYFNDEEVTHDTLQGYIDYFSDAMFKYPTMKSVNFHVKHSKEPIYLYEFCYVGKLSAKHYYMDRITGASHRDQSAYILDFYGYTKEHSDMDIRDIMTIMWTDFVKYGDPTAYESSLINFKWLPYTNEERNYLEINTTLTNKKNLFEDAYKFWDNIYDKHYLNPSPVKAIKKSTK